MKDILYKRRCDPKERVKAFSILQRSEDHECLTKIRKSFRYEVSVAKHKDEKLEAPQIYIKKSINSEKSLEKFSFQVKGAFYMTYQQFLLRIDFQHTLNIHLTWKIKDFSPKKKSELLT